MSNILWQLQNNQVAVEQPKSTYVASVDSQTIDELEDQIEQATSKLLDHIDELISDQSQYFMAEFIENQLSVFIADANKVECGSYCVELTLNLSKELIVELQQLGLQLNITVLESVQEIIFNHSSYMKYSLIALFSEGDRNKTRLI